MLRTGRAQTGRPKERVGSCVKAKQPAHAQASVSFPHRRLLPRMSRRCSPSGSLETLVTR